MLINNVGHSCEQVAVLWVKNDPYLPQWKHLLDAAAVSLALPNPLARWGWTSDKVALIVGLHDVGKRKLRGLW